MSGLSWQSLWPFGGHRPPLPAILCGHIWAMQALLDMEFGQNWRSANSYSQIGHLLPINETLVSRGVRTVLRRNRTVPYYTYSTPYCVFSLEMIRFGRRTLNTVRANVYKG
jgi:hypothetical protein